MKQQQMPKGLDEGFGFIMARCTFDQWCGWRTDAYTIEKAMEKQAEHLQQAHDDKRGYLRLVTHRRRKKLRAMD